MRTPNFLLVFSREIRDQLRDRRTLFTIVVLPMLLYPLMGTTFTQVAQFKREHASRIWVIGTQYLPEEPPLVQGDRFATSLLPADERDRIRLLTHVPDEPAEQAARRAIARGLCDAVLVIPPGMNVRLADLAETPPSETPQPKLIGDTTSERSRLALLRVERVLNRWREQLVERKLEQKELSPALVRPFSIQGVDAATPERKRSFGWSKILPFVAFLWALTGAFYPAIDMCAGEKERGTLETLLVSPASRLDIVFGKLLAVMSFSLGTCLLNLVGFAITGLLVLPRLQAGGTALFGAPPWEMLGWLVVALIPISALFSAVALALASFARTSKEGQYYLMPVLFICLPLMTFALLPGVSLTLATSLIPLTGVILWLRAVLEGRFAEVVWFLIPLSAVTFTACWIAIRWAVRQFHSESVLFAHGTASRRRWSFRTWWKRRPAHATWTHAFFVGVALLAIRFYASMLMPSLEGWSSFAVAQVLSLVATIALPAVAAAFFLTRTPWKTLRLNRFAPGAVLAAMLLAIVVHPLGMTIASVVAKLVPMSEGMAHQLAGMESLFTEAPLWQVLLVLALAPAVCEELAFRGFLLSGFATNNRAWRAVLASSLFFGLTHGIIQQSISAAIVGLLLGTLAIRTRSLWACIGFHAVYNSLTFVLALEGAQWIARWPILGYLWSTGPQEQIGYQTWATLAAGVVFVLWMGVWWRQHIRAHSRETRTPAPLAPAPPTGPHRLPVQITSS